MASSKAYKKPKIVTSNADSFVLVDIVIAVILIGRIAVIISIPAKMLPAARRMRGLVRVLLSSEMLTRVLIRGVFI